MGTTHYFRVLQNRFSHERTRATLAVTAGGSWDAAGLKRAREAARAHARGCGWTGGVAAVFRGGGAARLAERARARAGTWGFLVFGIREARASHPHGFGPVAVVAGEEKYRSPLPAAPRAAGPLVVSGKC